MTSKKKSVIRAVWRLRCKTDWSQTLSDERSSGSCATKHLKDLGGKPPSRAGGACDRPPPHVATLPDCGAPAAVQGCRDCREANTVPSRLVRGHKHLAEAAASGEVDPDSEAELQGISDEKDLESLS